MEKSHEVAQGAQAGDERAAFESDPAFVGMNFSRAEAHPEYYESPFVNGAWEGWQARAALATQPAAGEPAAWECFDGRYASLSYEREGDPERAVPLFRAAPPAAAHGDEAVRVMELLATCEWKLIKAIPADYLTDESNTKNAWWVERQQAPYCTESGERVWTGATAIEAFEKA